MSKQHRGLQERREERRGNDSHSSSPLPSSSRPSRSSLPTSLTLHISPLANFNRPPILNPQSIHPAILAAILATLLGFTLTLLLGLWALRLWGRKLRAEDEALKIGLESDWEGGRDDQEGEKVSTRSTGRVFVSGRNLAQMCLTNSTW